MVALQHWTSRDPNTITITQSYAVLQATDSSTRTAINHSFPERRVAAKVNINFGNAMDIRDEKMNEREQDRLLRNASHDSGVSA